MLIVSETELLTAAYIHLYDKNISYLRNLNEIQVTMTRVVVFNYSKLFASSGKRSTQMHSVAR